MINLILKLGITAMFLFNIYTGFLFYNVAIPVKVQDREKIIIANLADAFKISQQEAKMFLYHGKLKDIDPVLLASIAKVESGNRPDVVSPKGYKGRMQSDTKKYRFDSVETLNGTEEFKEWLKMRKGNVEFALASYNGGTYPPPVSYTYARTVLAIYNNAKTAVYSF